MVIFAWGQVLRRDLTGRVVLALVRLGCRVAIPARCRRTISRFALRVAASSIRNKRSLEEPTRRGLLLLLKACSFPTVARLGATDRMLFQLSLDPRLG